MTAISRAWLAPLALALLLSPVPARAADLTKYLPNDATVVGHLDLHQFRDSALFKKEIKEHIKKAKENDKTKEILDALNFDPEKDLQTITFGAPLAEDGASKGVAVLTGNFDVDRFQKLADKAADASNGKLKITKIGKHVVWEVSGIDSPPNVKLPDTAYIVLVDKTTMLIAGGKDVLKDALLKASGDKKTELSKTISAGLEAVDKKQSGWVLVDPAAIAKLDIPNAEKVGAVLQQFTSLSFGVTATNDIVMRADLTTGNAKVAQQLAVGFKRGLAAAPGLIGLVAAQNEQAAPFVDFLSDLVRTAKVTNKGSTVTVTLSMDKELIAKFEKAAKKAKGGGDK